MKTLRAVQLTDIHLLAGEDRLHFGVDTLMSLQRVLASISQLDPGPDSLIVTGDLAEDGAASTYHLLAKQLQQLHVPIYHLPGNHDDVAQMKVMNAYSNIHPCKSVELGNWVIGVSISPTANCNSNHTV